MCQKQRFAPKWGFLLPPPPKKKKSGPKMLNIIHIMVATINHYNIVINVVLFFKISGTWLNNCNKFSTICSLYQQL